MELGLACRQGLCKGLANCGLNADDVRLAYHGTKNTNRVKHILLEGYDPKYNKHGGSGFRSPDGAYFGVRPEVAQKSAMCFSSSFQRQHVSQFVAMALSLLQHPAPSLWVHTSGHQNGVLATCSCELL